MPSRTVVILGGGVGGIITANGLRRRLSNEHRIVLVERNAEHAFAPSFLWLMTGDRRPQQVRRPLSPTAAEQVWNSFMAVLKGSI